VADPVSIFRLIGQVHESDSSQPYCKCVVYVSKRKFIFTNCQDSSVAKFTAEKGRPNR
jgi:hypothetical protein